MPFGVFYLGDLKMGKGQRKYISLIELHQDEVEKLLIQEDERYGFIDIFCCDNDDYHYYEEDAYTYFMNKNIDIIDRFNENHRLSSTVITEHVSVVHSKEIYYKVNFDDINKNSTNPLIQLLLNDFEVLRETTIFHIYFMFFKDAWSVREDLHFDIVIADKSAPLYHRPSRFLLSTLNELSAPEYADNAFKKMVFNDIERRPRIYNSFTDIEDVVSNFENYAWMIDAITY